MKAWDLKGRGRAMSDLQGEGGIVWQVRSPSSPVYQTDFPRHTSSLNIGRDLEDSDKVPGFMS